MALLPFASGILAAFCTTRHRGCGTRWGVPRSGRAAPDPRRTLPSPEWVQALRSCCGAEAACARGLPRCGPRGTCAACAAQVVTLLVRPLLSPGPTLTRALLRAASTACVVVTERAQQTPGRLLPPRTGSLVAQPRGTAAARVFLVLRTRKAVPPRPALRRDGWLLWFPRARCGCAARRVLPGRRAR
jgi:hypothetical protein